MSSGIWYRVALSADEVAAGYVDAIRRLFAEAVGGLIDAQGACLFATGGGHAEDPVGVNADAVFFSPASITAVPHLIAQYRAQPSPPPDRAHAALLVGQPGDWDLLPRSTH